MSDEQPASFSPASARLAVDELYQALPKSKRLEFLGHLNEILVVIDRLTVRAKVDKEAAL